LLNTLQKYYYTVYYKNAKKQDNRDGVMDRTGALPRVSRGPEGQTSSRLILLAKSETLTIQGQDALVNSVCQSASPRENDFASRIKSGQEPESVDTIRGYSSPSKVATEPLIFRLGNDPQLTS
jgi:hypothetical protein